MKINNKGFAISGILYPVFILFIVLIFGIVGILASSKSLLDKITSEIEMELNGESLNPIMLLNGTNIDLAPGFSFNIYDGIRSFSYDGKEIGEDNINYSITPNLSVDANNMLDTSLSGEYEIVYTTLDSRGRSITETRTINIGNVEYDFLYTGTAQTFEVLGDGIYKLEAWGAQGNSGTYGLVDTGKGGYTSGEVVLTKDTNIGVYVGQGGQSSTVGGFNGGGMSGSFSDRNGGGGGGATDFRIYNNKFRYIKDFINGSTANTGNHWVEIEVYSNGVNVALNKNVTSLNPTSVDRPISWVTDGDNNTLNYTSHGSGPQWVEIDLGAEYEISHVIVWHYYSGTRSYYDSKTVLINEERSFEYPIFDSAHSSIYVETASGMTHYTDYWRAPGGLINRVMVAGAGGGSGSSSISKGHAGGLLGENSRAASYEAYGGNGATQIAGGPVPSNFSGMPGLTPGIMGVGGDGNQSSVYGFGSGGGSGYYGGSGGSGASSGHWGGGGGSSFVSGHTGANAMDMLGAPTGQPNHFSNIIFDATEILSGDQVMPNPLGGTQTGHSGHGYARISVLKRINE